MGTLRLHLLSLNYTHPGPFFFHYFAVALENRETRKRARPSRCVPRFRLLWAGLSVYHKCLIHNRLQVNVISFIGRTGIAKGAPLLGFWVTFACGLSVTYGDSDRRKCARRLSPTLETGPPFNLGPPDRERTPSTNPPREIPSGFSAKRGDGYLGWVLKRSNAPTPSSTSVRTEGNAGSGPTRFQTRVKSAARMARTAPGCGLNRINRPPEGAMGGLSHTGWNRVPPTSPRPEIPVLGGQRNRARKTRWAYLEKGPPVRKQAERTALVTTQTPMMNAAEKTPLTKSMTAMGVPPVRLRTSDGVLPGSACRGRHEVRVPRVTESPCRDLPQPSILVIGSRQEGRERRSWR